MRHGVRWWVAVLAGVVPGWAAGGASADVTDADVTRAIEKGKAYILSKQRLDGAWNDKVHYYADGAVGETELCLATLAFTGEHPNREMIAKGLQALLSRRLNYTYAVSARMIALAHLQGKLLGDRRRLVREALKRDALWLASTQNRGGGWGYLGQGGKMASNAYTDLSNTQMAMLALREAARAGIEVPDAVWVRSLKHYVTRQRPDGSWNYGETDKRAGGTNREGYGAMTAAGLASVLIAADFLDAASGCPCRGGRSGRVQSDLDRRVDAALQWLERNFSTTENPRGAEAFGKRIHYWFYSVERAGSAAGYKYFGGHDWFREIAKVLLGSQKEDGSWQGQYGPLITTCFCTMFLYKGRAPILFNKLQFDGQWNNHRRDVAHLVEYFKRFKEQPFHWQIVNLRAPVDELHDAPVLVMTAETAPEFSPLERSKLRRFTDTGGTILVEASCGNVAVRRWFRKFAAEVWPEWPLTALDNGHPVFNDPYPIKPLPELSSIHDGVRDVLFFSDEDLGCAWQLKAYAAKEYLFQLGVNVVHVATDAAPLRAKLAPASPVDTEPRYAAAVKAGPRCTLRLVRVRHGGDWQTGVVYGGPARLAAGLRERAGVTLRCLEAGTAAADLRPEDVALVTGSGPFTLTGDEIAALETAAEAGTWLWFEAATGSPKFDQSMRVLAERAGWTLRLMPETSDLVTGRMTPAVGHDLREEVQFRRALRIPRAGRDRAELIGIFKGDHMIGVYSPFDTLFAMTPYEAYDCRGYMPADAAAVATNVVLWATSHGPGSEVAEPAEDEAPEIPPPTEVPQPAEAP